MRLLATFAFVLPLWGGGCQLPPLTPAATDPEILVEQGRYRLAIPLLTGPDARTAYLRSKAEGGVGNLEASLHAAEHAIELDPGRSEYHVQLSAACGRLAEKASLLRQLGLARRAKKELEVALSIDPANIDALYGNMLFFHFAPTFAGGDKAKADAAVEAMTKLSPARGHLAHAQLAKERKDFTAEQEFYRRSLEADPKFYEAHAEYAAFLLASDRTSAAAHACEAVGLDPHRESAWTTLVEAAVLTQCWDEMFERLEAARAALPESREAAFAAGYSLVRTGRHYPWAVQFLEGYEGPNQAVAKAKLMEAHERINTALASH